MANKIPAKRQSSISQLDDKLLKKLTSQKRNFSLDPEEKYGILKSIFSSYQEMRDAKKKSDDENIVFLKENLNSAFIVMTKLKSLIEEKILLH